MLFQVLSLARKFGQSKSSANASAVRKPRSRAANLRLFALLPVLCTAIAFLLSFLLVYAGHKPGMMEEYAVFTLNTSRIGENMLQELDAKIESIHFKRSEPVFLPTATATTTPTITAAPTTMITMAPRGLRSDLTSLQSHAGSAIHSAGSAVQSKATSIESEAASVATSALAAAETKIINAVNKVYEGIIADLHLQDFYSIHISSSCTGTYVFQNGTNVTVGTGGLPTVKGANSVHRHVDDCSTRSALDPMSLIRVLYWIGTVSTGGALLAGIAGLILLPSHARKCSLINILATLPAFVFLGLASAVTHGLALGASKLINFVGSDIGVAGYMGGKFIAMTWATTTLLLANLTCWVLIFFLAGRHKEEGVSVQGQGFGWPSFGAKERNRPDRTSGVAMLPISRPMPVHDRNGVPMI